MLVQESPTPTLMQCPVTVVVLTKNEAGTIRECLDSVCLFTDDVHVVDSGSTDATPQIVDESPATLHHHLFTSFGTQRNWAIDKIPHRYHWVFHLDADERLTPNLVSEIVSIVSQDPSEAGYYVPHKLMLGDRWLRYAGGYPTYQVRLFHRERLRFIDHGHGQREQTTGKLGYLKHPYLHYAFSKGLDDWFAKHALYARAEAEQASRDDLELSRNLRLLFSSDPVNRRRGAKLLSYSMPARPFLRLLHTLVVKRGILDGRAGVTYARMLAAYESMVAVHLERIRAGVPL